MSCLPPNLREECEWFGLRNFVKHYNESCGTAYELEKCLDVKSQTRRPQPEVLVRSNGHRAMVIERKSVVWPPDYAKKHKKDHAFMSVLSEQLNPFFQDASYALEVDGSEVDTGNDSQVTAAAKQIATSILSARGSGNVDRLRGNVPIRWIFGPSDEWEFRRGVTIIVRSHRSLFDLGHSEQAIQGARAELAKQLAKTTPKFAEYGSCMRTVVVQFYGEDFSKEQVEEMVSRLAVPSGIDQLWMAYSDPVSDDEYEIKYHRVYLHPGCTTT